MDDNYTTHQATVVFDEAVAGAMERVRKAIRIGWRYNRSARPDLDTFAKAIGRQLIEEGPLIEDPWNEIPF